MRQCFAGIVIASVCSLQARALALAFHIHRAVIGADAHDGRAQSLPPCDMAPFIPRPSYLNPILITLSA